MKLFFAALSLFILCACSGDDDATATSVVVPISSNEVVGEWKVILYEERGVNETNDFQGYELEFLGNGDLIISKGGSFIIQGVWKILPGSDPGEPFELDMNIPTKDKPLSELHEDWDVKLKSASKIELEEISGGDGHLERLHIARL